MKIIFTILLSIFIISGCSTLDKKRIQKERHFIALCMIKHPIASNEKLRQCAYNLHLKNERFESLLFEKKILKTPN